MPTYSRPATIKGLPLGSITWNPDFRATLDDEGVWTGSVSFTCRYADIPNLLPYKGSPCQEAGWYFMALNGIEVSNNEGDTGVVTCKYKGSVTPDYGFDDQETDKAELEAIASSNISSSVNETPIEQHPKYIDVSTEDKQLMQELKNGRFKRSKTQPEDGAVYESKVDDIGVQIIKFTDPLAIELSNFISKGVLTYLDPTVIYSVTFGQKKQPRGSEIGEVGKIYSTPLNAPNVPAGRDWLMTAMNYQQDGKIYKITAEFRLSGEGGWEPLIYGE